LIEVDISEFLEDATRMSHMFHVAIAPGDQSTFTHSSFLYNHPVDGSGQLGEGGFPNYWIGVAYREREAGEWHCTIHRFAAFGDVPKDGDGEASFMPGYQLLRSVMT